MNLNLIAPVTHLTSYGIVATNLCASLCEQGHKVSLFPIGQVTLDPVCTWLHEPIKQSLKRGQLSYEVKAPCVRLYHQFSQDLFVGKGPHLAFPIFELDGFSELEKAQLSRVDHIISCSKWSKTIVDSELGVKSSIVNLGCDRRIFNPSPIQNGPTRFLLNGKIEVRKSTKEILDCFNRAFSPTDNVELYLCWHNMFMNEQELHEWVRYAQSLPIYPRLQILPRLDSIVQVAQLTKHVDCIVSMSKAEGWNLGLLEAHACAKHVIATNNTAQTEFCDTYNSYLIDTPDKEPAYDGKFFMGDSGNWHKIGKSQSNELVVLLKTIHEMKVQGELKPNESGLISSKGFTWENSANQLIQVLQNV